MADEVINSGAALSASVDTATIESAAAGVPASAAPPEVETSIPAVEGMEDQDLFGVPDDESGEDAGEPDDSEPGDADLETEEPIEPAAAEDAAAKPAEELPEGVEHKVTREGKHKYYLPAAVYQDHRSAVDLRGKLADVLGEDPTPEAIDLRNKAYLGYQRLESDLFSGNPESQRSAVEYWIDQSRAAMERGEVAVDPMIPLASTFAETLERHHPQAWGQLMQKAARSTFDDIYERAAEMIGGRSPEELQAAAQAGDQRASDALNTLYSIQRLDKFIFGNYKKATDLRTPQAADPLAAREAALAAREQQITQADRARSGERWTAFQQNVRGSVATGINEEVETALAGVAKNYERFPEQFERVKKDLTAVAREAMLKNPAITEQVQLLHDRARRAASEQMRQQIAQQIAQLYRSNARRYVAANRARVLTEAANALKAQNSATHERRASGEQRRAPAGGGTPVRRTLAPVPSADFEVATPAALARHAASLFGSR